MEQVRAIYLRPVKPFLNYSNNFKFVDGIFFDEKGNEERNIDHLIKYFKNNEIEKISLNSDGSTITIEKAVTRITEEIEINNILDKRELKVVVNYLKSNKKKSKTKCQPTRIKIWSKCGGS